MYWLFNIVNKLIGYKLKRAGIFEVGSEAKVNYLLTLLHSNKGRISIGKGSVVEGSLITEKRGAKIIIGKNTFMGRSTLISAKEIKIGNNVLIAWGVTMTDHNSHSIYSRHRLGDFKDLKSGNKNWSHVSMNPIEIKNGAWVGFNSIILKGVTIGKNAIVAAGSVISKNVPDNCVVGGNPAKIIKKIKAV